MVKFINAAGGLVQNEFGEYLLILRNGKWDLPKGKQDDGEELSFTALREVGEECGIKELVLSKPIASTQHSYWLDDLLVFKKTQWYHIYTPGRPKPCPQTQEGIEQCCWCSPKEAAQLLSQSYPSIRWLFQRATGIVRKKGVFLGQN